MPALLAAPPELESPPIPFFGRSLNEYSQFFALDPATLHGRAVLDVAAGPSSFVAEACRRGADAVAVDPVYGASPHALAQRVRADYESAFATIRSRRRSFKVNGRTAPVGARWPQPQNAARSRRRAFFGSLDEAEVDRRAAAQRFLADYEAHFAHGRYVGAALPQLPFLDGAFDLVLCAHLLFSDSSELDFDWHLAACRELARVSAGEVRIHPLCSAGGRPYPEIDALRGDLLASGIRSEIVDVDYEFIAGGSTMLVLNPERG